MTYRMSNRDHYYHASEIFTENLPSGGFTHTLMASGLSYKNLVVITSYRDIVCTAS